MPDVHSCWCIVAFLFKAVSALLRSCSKLFLHCCVLVQSCQDIVAFLFEAVSVGFLFKATSAFLRSSSKLSMLSAVLRFCSICWFIVMFLSAVLTTIMIAKLSV